MKARCVVVVIVVVVVVVVVVGFIVCKCVCKRFGYCLLVVVRFLSLQSVNFVVSLSCLCLCFGPVCSGKHCALFATSCVRLLLGFGDPNKNRLKQGGFAAVKAGEPSKTYSDHFNAQRRLSHVTIVKAAI